MPCSKCGAPTAIESHFCTQCGQPLSPALAHKAPYSDTKAILSMLLGMLSVLLTIFTGIPAVILGHWSRSSIRKSEGRLKGEGMAMAGLIMGYIGIFLFPIFAGITVFIIPTIFRSAIATNEASAVQTIKIINMATAGYQLENNLYPANLQELNANSLVALDGQLATLGVQNGYHFIYKVLPGQHGYVINADPTLPTTGQKHFYSDTTGTIRYEKDHPAGPNSPAVETRP